MTKLDLSIVIVYFNCWKYLKSCLDSISKQSHLPTEVIIVDNASISSIKKNIDNYGNQTFDIHLIENKDNMGFAKGCNIGFQYVQQTHVLFCNPDIEIPVDGLATLFKQYQENDVNLLGCFSTNQAGKAQKIGSVFPRTTHMMPVIGRLIKKQQLKKFIKYNDLVYADWITGAAIFCSRYDFIKIGLWNEHYFMYMEDVSLGQQAKSHGMKVAYTTATTWMHHHGKSSASRCIDRIRSKSALIESKHKYIKMYFNEANKPLAHFLLFLSHLPELMTASILAPFIHIKELKVKQQVAKNTLIFYYKNLFKKRKTTVQPRIG